MHLVFHNHSDRNRPASRRNVFPVTFFQTSRCQHWKCCSQALKYLLDAVSRRITALLTAPLHHDSCVGFSFKRVCLEIRHNAFEHVGRMRKRGGASGGTLGHLLYSNALFMVSVSSPFTCLWLLMLSVCYFELVTAKQE